MSWGENLYTKSFTTFFFSIISVLQNSLQSSCQYQTEMRTFFFFIISKSRLVLTTVKWRVFLENNSSNNWDNSSMTMAVERELSEKLALNTCIKRNNWWMTWKLTRKVSKRMKSIKSTYLISFFMSVGSGSSTSGANLTSSHTRSRS